MDRRAVLLWVCLFVWTALYAAQDVPPGVITAFGKGNSLGLNTYLGDEVELIIENRTVTVDRRGAESQMETFFSAHKVESFTINHQGKRDESGFFIGTLKTVDGNFRVNCFFRKVSEQYVIHQIRIDKINE